MQRMRDETAAILSRYERRTRAYDPIDPSVYLPRQELERFLAHWLVLAKLTPVERLSVLEVGCGSGGNLAQFLRLGLRPERLVGNELQEPLLAAARELLPAGVRLLSGDALDVELPRGSFHVVLQSLVFSSILSDQYQEELAGKMWDWACPGGGVLWYDFTVNNPSNPDVRGVPLDRVRKLFPDAIVRSWRLTLAPPVSRLVTRLHPSLYGWCNLIPWLRTHRVCWLQKPGELET